MENSIKKDGFAWEFRRGSKKDVCPACGKRRFVPYVSARDHRTPAGAEFGRCDREQNCGYYRYPTGEREPNVPRVELPRLAPIRFAPSIVCPSSHSALFTYAAHLVGTAAAVEVWRAYRIGTTPEGRAIFWQINKQGEAVAGKAILYDAYGHRNKEAAPPVNWLHKMRYYAPYVSGGELVQCFFGEHLLRECKDDPVVIVESEKTAALLSAILPQFVWLASGGSQGLKNSYKNKALQGRDVLLIPDHGQRWNWQTAASANGWRICTYCDAFPIFDGCDILDYVDSMRKAGKTIQETKDFLLNILQK